MSQQDLTNYGAIERIVQRAVGELSSHVDAQVGMVRGDLSRSQSELTQLR